MNSDSKTTMLQTRKNYINDLLFFVVLMFGFLVPALITYFRSCSSSHSCALGMVDVFNVTNSSTFYGAKCGGSSGRSCVGVSLHLESWVAKSRVCDIIVDRVYTNSADALSDNAQRLGKNMTMQWINKSCRFLDVALMLCPISITLFALAGLFLVVMISYSVQYYQTVKGATFSNRTESQEGKQPARDIEWLGIPV